MARPLTLSQQARRRAERMLDLQGTRVLLVAELARWIAEHPAEYGEFLGLAAHWQGPLAAAERRLQQRLEADLAARDGRCTRDAA